MAYLSLNSVEEWPDQFEESFKNWAAHLNDIIIKMDSNDPENLVKVKKVAIDIVRLICFRFGEHCSIYIQPFFESIWKLLPILPSAREYNKIVQSLINYINDALNENTLLKLIENEMETLFNHLILKHLSFTPEDLEEFDCNEEAFIKMDLEEHDKETRRRACYNLVVKLSNVFPQKIGEIVQHF
jgi:hypothetical protein